MLLTYERFKAVAGQVGEDPFEALNNVGVDDAEGLVDAISFNLTGKHLYDRVGIEDITSHAAAAGVMLGLATGIVIGREDMADQVSTEVGDNRDDLEGTTLEVGPDETPEA